MINAIIIEDNLNFRKGIETLLTHTPEFQLSGAFGDAESAINYLKTNSIDLILMDIDLPGINGIDATLEIKKQYPTIEIVIVTVFESSTKVFDALCAGATGYITKNSSIEKIKLTLMELVNGGAPMSSNIARMVVTSFQKNFESPLSDRETTVLKSLSEGLTYSMIADQLFISKETVKSHIKQIYQKLEVHSKSEAIALAKQNKYL